MAPLTHRALLALVLGLLAPSPAGAQCGSGGSSCVTCHEARSQHPVLDDGRPWHADHAFGDVCVGCHGGERSEPEASLAHATMHDALAIEGCTSCHDDGVTRRARYVAAPDDPAPSAPSPPTPPASSPPSHRVADAALTAVVALLTLVLAALLAWRRGAHLADVARWWRAPRWTPHAAGALLGLTVTASYALRERALGISGAVDAMAGYVGQAIAPDATYWRDVVPVGIDERTLVVVGVLFGALLSSAFSGTLRLRWLPDRGWTERFGGARATRLGLAFVGAILVQFGAGIAGGCTSGLAISGGALLSPAAFVFVAGMFAGGIPIAVLAAHRMGKP